MEASLNRDFQMGLYEALSSLEPSSQKISFWNRMEKHLSEKILDEAFKLQSVANHVPNMKIEEAEQGLEVLVTLIPLFNKVEKLYKSGKVKSKKIQSSAETLFHSFHRLYDALDDLCDVDGPYEMTSKNFDDWDDPVNDHWDSYTK